MSLGAERSAVQNPFLRSAEEAGWSYLSPEAALNLRRGITSPVLDAVLIQQLQRLNPGVRRILSGDPTSQAQSLNGERGRVMECCSESKYAWDQYKVATAWFPSELRCLIVGENPGDVGAPYFYENLRCCDHDPVEVRRNLLRGLHKEGLIQAPTLEAFRDAGFLFDHAIRCHLPSSTVRNERRLADHFASPRAASAAHLKPLIAQARKVWVMGRIARNAIAELDRGFPRDQQKISQPPYPMQIKAQVLCFALPHAPVV